MRILQVRPRLFSFVSENGCLKFVRSGNTCRIEPNLGGATVDLNAGPANVFISCGDARAAEKAIAHEVAARLERMGFKPYVAVEVHDLRGLANNIYAQLDASEYFLFIDFKREY